MQTHESSISASIHKQSIGVPLYVLTTHGQLSGLTYIRKYGGSGMNVGNIII